MRLNLKDLTLIVAVMTACAFALGFERTSETKQLTVEEYNETLPPAKRIDPDKSLNDSQRISVTTQSVTLSPFDMARGALIGGIVARILVYVLQKRRQKKEKCNA